MIDALRRFSPWALLFGAFTAWAQPYPNKPIRVMVGYAPGGSADAGARPLAKALTRPGLL